MAPSDAGDDQSVFLIEICGFLNELGCPVTALTQQGGLESGLDNRVRLIGEFGCAGTEDQRSCCSRNGLC